MYGIEGLLAGRTLMDRYHIEEVIGRGGMGAVYRARDQRLGREVAVKVIGVAAADAEAHERLRARFQREARAAATLHHPNVVSVYDYGTDPVLGLDFFVMELLRGEDLATRLSRKGPPALSTALEIVYQAARGLAAGHRAGLIHRDVKPGNLFLEPGDRVGEVHVRVLDFGIAEIAASEDGTVTHLTVIGRSPFSPAFASPEQMRGETRLSPATDVFSLGAVAFQLLTGKRAFSSVDPREMVAELSSNMAAELPRVRELPPGARQVVQRALAPDVRDRFPHAGAMAEALAPLVSEGALRMQRAEEPRTGPAIASEREHTEMWRPEGARSSEFLADGTQLLSGPPLRHATAPPRLDPRLTHGRREVERHSPAPPPLPPPRTGRLRRAARATWSFCLTLAALALFAGAWLFAISGLNEGDLQRVYAGAAASVFLTPLALHRLMGGRGSYRFALFASIAASLGAVYLLAGSGEVGAVLAALFVAQVGVSYAAERLSRGRRADQGLLTEFEG